MDSVRAETCSFCGGRLALNDPGGLCPNCLMRGAWDAPGSDVSEEPTVLANEVSMEDDFGRYHLVRSLGEGGMGVVYLAEQREPILRLVAIKVVKAGMDTEHVLARFAQERQALAMMDHPNIARILDAGTTAKGRPYFVMEYMDGKPISQYCDDKRIPIAKRLELFQTVCTAVQHAHKKGVIHRDLKPSNVLVLEQEGAPVPKVIDFGIAKAREPWGQATLTQMGQVIGTPEYASPEQASVTGGAIDERADVYSLGVMLYELLIGAVPFDAAKLRDAGFVGMMRIIQEEDAPSLSKRFSSLGPATAEIAARRQTDPGSLRRVVDGDLNAITMKALEKPRERRYGSVAELGSDIQRYLGNRPVSASRPGWIHRTRKFVRRHRMPVAGIAAGVLFVMMGSVTVWSLVHRTSGPPIKLTDKDTLVLAEFDNRTGDPVFDETLRQGFSVELQQNPNLALISDRVVAKQLDLMKEPKGAKLTGDLAYHICERTSSAAVLDGSIAYLGSQYVLSMQAKDCANGNVLYQDQEVAGRKEDVLKAISAIARRFRVKAGESMAQITKRASPLAEATTSSIDALKAYTTATRVALTSGHSAALPFQLKAVEIDPSFAVAHAQLGLVYSSLGESAKSAESTLRAWNLRQRASGWERYFIEFLYYRQVTGNLEKAYETLQVWAQTYPRAQPVSAFGLMAGRSTHGTGRYDVAIKAAKDRLVAEPQLSMHYGNLAWSYFLTDRFAEAEGLLRTAQERKVQSPSLHILWYNLAVLNGDQALMKTLLASARGKRQVEHWIAHQEALALARVGRLREARQSSNRALELATQEGARETVSSYKAARAVWEAICGNGPEAAKWAGAALQDRGREVEYAAGLALAVSRDVGKSEALAADLEKRFPEDTFAKFGYVPVLRALALLQEGKPGDAVERLQITLQYELAANGLNFEHQYLGGLHSAYVRGQALSALGRHTEAASEFQKIFDHRGIVGLDPIGAAAYVYLARALAASGDKVKAKGALDKFLILWKKADPGIPLMKEAKAELANL